MNFSSWLRSWLNDVVQQDNEEVGLFAWQMAREIEVSLEEGNNKKIRELYEDARCFGAFRLLDYVDQDIVQMIVEGDDDSDRPDYWAYVGRCIKNRIENSGKLGRLEVKKNRMAKEAMYRYGIELSDGSRYNLYASRRDGKMGKRFHHELPISRKKLEEFLKKDLSEELPGSREQIETEATIEQLHAEEVRAREYSRMILEEYHRERRENEKFMDSLFQNNSEPKKTSSDCESETQSQIPEPKKEKYSVKRYTKPGSTRQCAPMSSGSSPFAGL